MTNGENPTILRRRLGAELRSMREQRNMTSERLSELMEWDRTKVSRIERGKQKIQPKELRELLGHLGVVTPETVAAYVDMAREAKKRGWWSAYGPLPKLYDTYVGLEASASEIRCWEPYVANGLLQTEDYARAITAASSPGLTPEEVDRQVKVRLERQARLSNVPLWVVLDESVLYRAIGGKEVLNQQLEHLIELGREARVTLQVLPFDEGAHPAGRGSITIMSLNDGDVIYADTPAGQIYPEGEHAEACKLALEHIRAKALSPHKSLSLIKSVHARNGERF